MNSVYAAVTRGPAWRNTVFVINYDEWGGFFDHVPPPTAPIPPATANSLAEVLQFARPDFAAKQVDVPPGPFGQPCVPGVPDETDEEWLPLLTLAAGYDWPVRLSVPV